MVMPGGLAEGLSGAYSGAIDWDLQPAGAGWASGRGVSGAPLTKGYPPLT
jgi:hypothetical protein